MRLAPVATSTSSTSARRYSTSSPFSVMLLLEPTPTYSLLPSGLASSDLVQWWLIVPGRSANSTPGAVMRVAPDTYGYLTIASVLATYNVAPISCTPNGECRLSRKSCFSHSPAAPGTWRNNVMRLPPLAPLPERAFTLPANHCLGVVTGSVPGPLDSTTSTSPFGSISSWRGCIRPVAMGSMVNPAATLGVWPCFQPTPVGTCMGGIR